MITRTIILIVTWPLEVRNLKLFQGHFLFDTIRSSSLHKVANIFARIFFFVIVEQHLGHSFSPRNYFIAKSNYCNADRHRFIEKFKSTSD